MPRDEFLQNHRPCAAQAFAEAERCRGARRESAWNKAFGLFKAAAAKGNSGAMLALARCYWEGLGAARSKELSFAWLRRAAHAEHPDALCQLGILLINKPGRDDRKDGVSHLLHAASRNHASAQFAVGNCYLNGVGLPKDHNEGIRWMLKATALGHEGAKQALVQLTKVKHQTDREGGIVVIKCHGTTQKGKRCNKRAIKGTWYCNWHKDQKQPHPGLEDTAATTTCGRDGGAEDTPAAATQRKPQPEASSCQCKGVTNQGRRCRKRVGAGNGQYCHFHRSQAMSW